MQVGRALLPLEKARLSTPCAGALARTPALTLADPTIPQVWQVIAQPDADLARELGLPRDDVDLARDKLEHVRHGLGNMVDGSLGGLFDAPSTVRLDFDAPIQTVDLSRLDGRGDETRRHGAGLRLLVVPGRRSTSPAAGPAVVRDEVWRAMRVPAMIRKIDSDLRLSRAHGTIQMLATHRLSDFEQVGAAGCEEVAIARNLIASCDTRVLLAQDTGPLAMTRDAIGLTDAECEHIGSWSAEHKGYALWKVGRAASHIVRTALPRPSWSCSTPTSGWFVKVQVHGAVEGPQATREPADLCGGSSARDRLSPRSVSFSAERNRLRRERHGADRLGSCRRRSRRRARLLCTTRWEP